MLLSYLWSKIVRRACGAVVRNSEVGFDSAVEPRSAFIDSMMGRQSFCGYDCNIVGADIGNFCSIANSETIGGRWPPVERAGVSPVFHEGRAVVTKDVLPYEVGAGSSGRHPRFRSDERFRAALPASGWWESDDVAQAQCAHEIRKPGRFLQEFSRCA